MDATPQKLLQRITEARQTLDLGEEATLAEIEATVRTLLKRWHPDRCQEDPQRCTEMTRRILEASKTLRDYCANYRFSFRPEEVEKYLSPAEWMESRFGGKPFWASGKEGSITTADQHRVTKKRQGGRE
ncbi:MAG: J domain-containing protein [Magnetococcales bacterium]|nr:J domain-containing protein [Magnetococcales bacterium]